MSALEAPHIPTISLTTCLYVNCLHELRGVVKLQYKNQYKHERLEAAMIQFKTLSTHYQATTKIANSTGKTKIF
jgi:hypothetical protein